MIAENLLRASQQLHKCSKWNVTSNCPHSKGMGNVVTPKGNLPLMGVPTSDGGTYTGLGYLPWTRVGTPHPGRESSTVSTCYVFGGMSLVLKQEEFFVNFC